MMGPSTGPEMLLFKRFKSHWPTVVKDNFKPGTDNDEVLQAVNDVKEDMVAFLLEQLAGTQPRDDYLELLELSLIFLGGMPLRGIHFKKPGAVYRARFMARLIYAIKIFLFRAEGFVLTRKELVNLQNFCIFGVKVYVKSWFLSRLSTTAPANDLCLLKSIVNFKQINPALAGAVLKKLNGQLWYLSEELVALSFFDPSVTIEEKKAMVESLKTEGTEEPLKRISVKEGEILGLALHDFVTRNTLKFFEILGLPVDFLEKDPNTWHENYGYLDAEQIVRKLRVVNDTAERGVALIQEYNAILTKDEDQTL